MEIALAFDNDEAGQKATLRIGKNLLESLSIWNSPDKPPGLPKTHLGLLLGIKKCPEEIWGKPEEEEWWRKQWWEYQQWEDWQRSIPSERNREQLLLPELSKTFLKEKIKDLKQQCYDIIQEKSNYNGPAEFKEGANSEFEQRHQILLKRIRDYTYRLRPVSKGRGTEITPDTIRRAKESPIQDNLVGWKCRRLGKTLVGKCPFHTEKSGSFYIYLNDNRFHCFGCGADGTVIDVIMKLNNLDFISAVKFLCRI